MKRQILLLITVLLVACGGGDEARPTVSPFAASLTPTVMSAAAVVTPTLTATAPVATIPAVPRESRPTPLPSGPASSPEGPLPTWAGEVTLGPPLSVCSGEGASVGEDGTVYTWGQRDAQPCASVIDLRTTTVVPVAPSALPVPAQRALKVSDPGHGRVYVAEGVVVTAYDADGQALGPVLALPPGEPEGFSTITSLRLAKDTDRLYVGYQDFDGDAWIALVNLAGGGTIVDVPVPAGPWALTADQQLVFADVNTLVVLDGATLKVSQRLSLSRRPADAMVDPVGRRLFVADAGGDLHVLDAVSLAERDRLPGLGAALDLDNRLGRLYVGDRYSGGVHVLDLNTLESLGTIPQPGQPVASLADGRVYIVEEGVYQADGATLQLIAGRSARNGGCNGCVYPTDVVVDPNSGLIYTTTCSIWAGKPGQADQAAVDPVSGRAFVARTSGGYQLVYSLALYDDPSAGQLDRWVDGLYGQPLYNPANDQLYLAHGERLIVLGGQSLAFLGSLDVGKGLVLLAVDAQSGQLYAAQGEQLLRFEPQGAVLSAPAPEPVDGLPGPVYGISISPNFAQDTTLFARVADGESGRTDLYRSRDGGQRWVRVRGGLPGPPNDLVFAPAGRLYAALATTGWRAPAGAATWGEGVYVSDDGGDTWWPDNRGLTHLRVERLHVAMDGTLFALAASAVEPGHVASAPTIWARVPGQDWVPLSVPDAGPLRLEDYAVPTGYILAVWAYWHDLCGGGPLYQSWVNELRRSDDGGLTWRSVGRGPADYADDVVKGRDVYWVGPQALWRSTDEGATWAALRHPALNGPPFLVTVADVDGAETLFLGTETGQVLVVPVAEADWSETDR